MRRLLLITLLVLAGIATHAGITTRSAKLNGTSIATNGYIDLEDDQYSYMVNNSSWTQEFINKSYSNRVTLKYTGAARSYYSQPWTLDVHFTLERWNSQGQQILPNETGVLTIDYNPAAQTAYTDISTYVSTAPGFKTKLTVTNIVPGASLSGIIPADVMLESEIEVERYYFMDISQQIPVTHTQNLTDKTIRFEWDYLLGAEEYDLEWLFVSAYDPLAAALPDFQKATRVTTTNQYYQISDSYDKGFIVYRVRGAGRYGQGYNKRLEGAWSSTSPYIAVNNLESTRNWTYSSVYAEEGKIKESVSFFDGSTRARQAVTRSSTENVALVQENFYDYEGRLGIQAMVAPERNRDSELKFYSSFNLNPNGTPYNRRDFDHDSLYATGCSRMAPQYMLDDNVNLQGNGASYYYSDKNGFKDISFNALIPDARDYPFSQVVYNNAGEVSKTSGIGADFTIGSGHEQEHYIATPSQTKLDRMFGNEAGYAEFYKLSATKDPNGQLSLTYYGLAGNVVATALAGDAPASMDALEAPDEPYTTPQLVTDHFNSINHYIASEEAMVVQSNFLVTNPGTSSAPTPYVFTYELTPEQYSAVCAGTTHDCVYDLVITIYDECATPLSSVPSTALGQVHVINGASFSSGNPYTLTFTVYFPRIGVYRIEKRLTLNAAALNSAVAAFEAAIASNEEQTCIDGLEDLLTSYNAAVDLSNCNTCEQEYQARCETAATTAGHTPASQAWNDYVAACIEQECTFTVTENSCVVLLGHLKDDMSPGGQYFDNIHASDPAGTQPSGTYYTSIYTNTGFVSGFMNFVGTSSNNCPAPPNNDYSWSNIRANWNDCYADYLVQYHPEYCRYERCMDLDNSTVLDMTLQLNGSYQWATTHPTASQPYLDVNLSPPVVGQSLLDLDPYFNDANLGLTSKSIMAAILQDEDGNGPGTNSMWQQAVSMAGTGATSDQQWQMFRSLYLSHKFAFTSAYGCAAMCDNTPAVPDNVSDCGGVNNDFHINDPDHYPYISDMTPNGNTDPQEYGDELTSSNDICKTPASFTITLASNFDASLCPVTINVTGANGTTEITGSVPCNSSTAANQLVINIVQAINLYTSSPYDFTAAVDPNNPLTFKIYAPASMGADGNMLTMNSTFFAISNQKFIGGSNVGECPGMIHCLCGQLDQIADFYALDDGQYIDQSLYPTAGEYIAHALGAAYNITLTTAQVNEWMTNCSTSVNTTPLELLNGQPVEPQDYPVPSQLDCDQAPGCADDAYTIAGFYATEEYQEQLEQEKEDFIRNYKAECFKGILNGGVFSENFQVEYTEKEYHYTLYYYDRAGDLVRTVSPAAVQLLAGTALDAVHNHRIGLPGYSYTVPNHSRTAQTGSNTHNPLVVNYKYDSRHSVIEKETADGGKTNIYYDRIGKPRFSQDARQADIGPGPHPTGYEGKYTYMIYDAVGRIIETGESDEIFISGSLSVPFYQGVDDPSFPSQPASQVTKNYYNSAIQGNPVQTVFTNSQQELRMRVASTTYEEVEDANNNTYDHATHYSYDIEGNVKELVQENSALASINHQYKKISYKYDLISGNTNEVHYQDGNPDQLHYRYYYDADNRITNVYTSRNNVHWEQDVKYFYYLHGPVARIETGDEKVQGTDHAFTINGWIKGVNSSLLDRSKDIGKDGLAGNAYLPSQVDVHNNVAADAFGYVLSYFTNDYSAIKSSATNNLLADLGSAPSYTAANDLFNGNIKEMAVAMMSPNGSSLPTLVPLKVSEYRYDQLSRIKDAKVYTGNGPTYSSVSNANNDYWEHYRYDPDGNIKELQRLAYTGTHTNAMDNLQYQYINNTNQLDYVNDIGDNANTTLGFGDIRTGQATGNYVYDKVGNLTKDIAEDINKITWSNRGKVLKVERISTSPKPDLEFKYDSQGHRVMKLEKTKDATGALKPQQDWIYTYYVLDPSGVPLATYQERLTAVTNVVDLYLDDQYIQGHARLGVAHRGINLTTPVTPVTGMNTRRLGNKEYECANHLGNVMVTISDRKLGVQSIAAPALVDHYVADVTSFTDYYAFGMQMPGRYAGGYKYGFNGMEKDDEMKGSGNSYTTEFRQYDSRLGKWLSIDPLSPLFPWQSPYVAFDNNPTNVTDPTGLVGEPVTHKTQKGDTYSSISKKYGVSVENLRKWNKYKDTGIPIGVDIRLNAPDEKLPAKDLSGLITKGADISQVKLSDYENGDDIDMIYQAYYNSDQYKNIDQKWKDVQYAFWQGEINEDLKPTLSKVESNILLASSEFKTKIYGAGTATFIGGSILITTGVVSAPYIAAAWSSAGELTVTTYFYANGIYGRLAQTAIQGTLTAMINNLPRNVVNSKAFWELFKYLLKQSNKRDILKDAKSLQRLYKKMEQEMQ